jgi:hypothetical protein
MNWADLEEDSDSSIENDNKLKEESKKEEEYHMQINYTNTTVIKTRKMEELIKRMENLDESNDKFKKIYHYVTGRIKTPFNQFTKMIRVDYHYHERKVQINRIYTVNTKEEFINLLDKCMDDFTEEIFKNCFIYENNLYLPFLYCESTGKFYDMLKYIKIGYEYEFMLYMIPF